jgi:putative ABC transport system ATP-binding protein
MSELLSINGVTKSFPDGARTRTVLDGVQLGVAAGELVAIMGPSGSGKSTLLHLVAGMDRPDHGQIVVNGTHLSALNASELATLRRTQIGYVEQRLNLIAVLSAVENVMLPLELGGVSTRQARQQAIAQLDTLGIAELADQDAERLSGGEQQRVAIARALVGGRRLLLADEPTAALDSLNGEAVMRLIRGRCDEDGVAALMCTHDASHAAWADRVVFLHDGAVIDEATPLDERRLFSTDETDGAGSTGESAAADSTNQPVTFDEADR